MSKNHASPARRAGAPLLPFDGSPADPANESDFPFDLPHAPSTHAPGASAGPGDARTAPPIRGDDLPISQRAIAASRAAQPPVAQPPVATSDYLSGLNPEQAVAVETLDGPVLVLAGAGTGKTRVLTTRIAHILAVGRAWPSQILAVTFTNKAAREMRERIGHLVGGAVEGMPWLGTFHSIGVKILRRHCELVGLKPTFTILDTDDQLRLMKQVIEAADIDKDRWPARQLASLIDGWKNKGLTPDKVPNTEGFAFANGRGRELYAAYQHRLKELNAVDFGDLLLEGLRLFRENPDVLAEYQRRFRFILVDEYQDTNVVQYLWLRLLAAGSPNICCVGDDDQSIYGWRGAEVENILKFDKDFPGAAVIRLERNYRSKGHILGAAAGLIANNQGRLGKTLFTDDDMGEQVAVSNYWDDEEEARAIGNEIEQLQKARQPLNGVAILVRASFQMRVIEDRFITLGLPYRVVGGPRFYERAEIKDAIAYLEVTQNPANDLKFERIVNVPKRGLGDTSVQRIRDLARAREVSLFQAAREILETEEIGGKARRALADLIASFERWRGDVGKVRHTELAERILDESGYTAMWQAEKSPQAQSRLENLKELVRFMHDFDTLEGFLEHISLVMDVDQGDDGDRVTLMTLHAAKGLEFATVFLPGWEEGLFPHQRSLEESGLAGLEEERRLAYVGLTRARRRARVSFAQNRRNRGLFQSAVPSRFVDELPAAHVEVVETQAPFGGAYRDLGSGFGKSNPFGPSRFDSRSGGGNNGAGGAGGRGGGGFREPPASYTTPGWQRAQAHQQASQWQPGGGRSSAASGPAKFEQGRRRGPATIEGQLVASSSAASAAFTVGERVFHQKFGYGLVEAVDGNKLTVAFEKAGTKRVVDSFLDPAPPA